MSDIPMEQQPPPVVADDGPHRQDDVTDGRPLPPQTEVSDVFVWIMVAVPLVAALVNIGYLRAYGAESLPH